MRAFLISLLLFVIMGETQALTVSDVKLSCYDIDPTNNVVGARLSFNVQVGLDFGAPGLMYLAMHNQSMSRAMFFTLDGDWAEWTGGQFPVYRVMRGGMQDMNIAIDLGSRYMDFQGFDLYGGYGLFLPKMEDTVRKRRTGLEKARQKFPGRPIYDPGDDYMRRVLIEQEMKDNKRYVKVMTINSCFGALL